jgi:hypothetical protein
MTSDRAFLKKAIVALLDAIAQEQSPGHQESKAGRYVLISNDGTPVEVMFEKNKNAPPNIWCLERAAGAALMRSVPCRRSPASDLRAARGKDGELLYGRHSALERMQQLGEADLVCFAPETLAHVGQIIDRLRSVTAADLL